MPEDTEFAVWLGVQLANAGYRVWSEATQLIGGERFWSDIEAAFDTVIGKTVVVISGVTRAKAGVLDEIERAVATAERLAIPQGKFIVPVAATALKRGDTPIQLARQNAIPFHSSWAEGLARLLKLLARDNFPRTAEPRAVGAWVAAWFEGRHRVVVRGVELMTNALGIAELPRHVRFYNVGVGADQLKRLPEQLPVPSAVNGALLLTFADEDELRALLPQETRLTRRAEVEIEAFLDGHVKRGDPFVSRRDASNHMVSMLRKAWDRLCRERGLEAMTMSSGQKGWFLPLGTVPGQFVRFVDFDGRARKRYLYGVKTRKVGDTRVVGMHWHYAPRLQFALGQVNEALVEAHVAFTINGRELLGDAAKAHKLRRSFCKQWFNEQWRTLHLAYFSFLANGGDQIKLPVSRDQHCLLDVRPESLLSSVSFDPPLPKARRSEQVLVTPSASAAAAAEEVPEDDLDADVDDDLDAWDEFGGGDEA